MTRSPGHDAPAAAPGRCEWSYEGPTGPRHWGELCPEYCVCKNGEAQSPIDLCRPEMLTLPTLEFSYRESPLEVVDTGHGIRVNVDEGNRLIIGSERYSLVQYHFHAPSEHRLEGDLFDMEIHFVHENEVGEGAVAGVFVKARSGRRNPAIQEIWDRVPPSVRPPAALNPAHLLPIDRRYFRYAGSLTTPPCSEGFRWHVLRAPIEISEEQLAEFHGWYAMNARPIQPLHGRRLLFGGN
jgi:carbonic anhydrase